MTSVCDLMKFQAITNGSSALVSCSHIGGSTNRKWLDFFVPKSSKPRTTIEITYWCDRCFKTGDSNNPPPLGANLNTPRFCRGWFNLVFYYALKFLRRTFIPRIPNPLTNNQTAPGIGTEDKDEILVEK